MSDAEDMTAKSKALAKEILDALDRPDSAEKLAYLEQKDRDDKAAYERLYIATGQKQWVPAPVAQGPLIAAWDYSADPPGLAMVAVAPSGGKRVAYKEVPKTRRDTTTVELKSRGVRVGGFYGGSDFVWVADEYGASVWAKDGVKLEGTRDALVLPSGKLKTADIKTIVSFVGDDYVQRGVKAELVDGKQVTLVEERDEIAQLDPTFGRNELLESDAWWASYLGRDLAAALRVPHRDEAFGTTSDPAIVAVLQDLADRIQGLAPAGEFQPIEVPFATADGKRATLRFAALPAAPDGDRVVEVAVAAPSGKSTSAQRVTKGSNELVVAVLRRAETVHEVTRTISALVGSLARQDFR